MGHAVRASTVVAIAGIGLLSMATGASVGAQPAPVHERRASPAACAPRDGLTFVCGITHPEDLVRVPGTRWVIASSFIVSPNGGQPAPLYAIDVTTRSVQQIAVDLAAPAHRATAECPAPPTQFGAHGLAIGPGRQGKPTLYAVNHAVRESVEMFEISATRARVGLRWLGCVTFASKLFLNSVAATPDGGFVVTNLLDRTDPERWPKMRSGRPTGRVYRWAPGQGIRAVPETEFAGDNGILVDPRGTMFVAAWGGHAIIRLRRCGQHMCTTSVPVDFLPDNLRWDANGNILIAGQRRDLAHFLEPCQPAPCRVAWTVARLDVKRMKVVELARGDGTGFTDATTALEVGDSLWLGSASDNRIAIMANDTVR
ncbi:hypothetical protein [Sphingomonas glacialis]|uniref:SMP-30/Gluconolactonase/LRE-like region domain-containing protein n=1 Tax=Sphingomonas glacialis TaxID=658225 RepID=A0A502FYG7_9SPHN|nr:hypothetical protein [Sphingomonas glacialis]TPG54575.1 hypothetical protein EAH76_08025 [Sphingomonas glacialis]